MNVLESVGLAFIALLGPAAIIVTFYFLSRDRKRLKLIHEKMEVFNVPKKDVDEHKIMLDITLNGTHFAIVKGTIWRDKIKIYDNGKWINGNS